ncbi:MAG: hypothetical protein JO340_18275 [Acidobacteriaceae bacterium]|nr:hypothetical protein [Acidobacteriaceae bacterium]
MATPARADSLPTFTASSASATVETGPIYWSISGSNFGLGGSGDFAGYLAFDVAPGSSFGLDLVAGLDPLQLTSYFGGSSGNTAGEVTIAGATEYVQLQTTPEIYFSTAGVTVPYGANPVIRLAATLTGSAVASECLGPGLVPTTCGAGPYYGFLPVANINIDVPGYIIFRGGYDPSSGTDTFSYAQFVSSPEPISGALTLTGLLLWAGAARLRGKLGKPSRHAAPLVQA